MRIWSLHPKYLDSRGLVALWRETLLAQAVLLGRTSGYRHHPQLDRFRAQAKPVALVATYLHTIWNEASNRAYAFDATKIHSERTSRRLTVTRGQLEYEWEHLLAKLEVRDPVRASMLGGVKRPQSNPFFRVVPGDVARWEKIG
jgi:hypothetical protein